jgi:hypothetical protein
MRCEVCQQTEEWHREHHPMHQFSPEGTEVRLTVPESPPEPPGQGHVKPGGDLLLRLTLIKLGLITQQELDHTQRAMELAVQQGKALVVVPDPEDAGQLRFQLLGLNDLAQSVATS